MNFHFSIFCIYPSIDWKKLHQKYFLFSKKLNIVLTVIFQYMGFKQNHLTCKYQNRENMCVFILYFLLSYKNYGIYTKVLNFYGWLHDYLWCSFVCKDIFLFKKRFTVNFTVLAQMHFKTNHKMSWVLSERRLLANKIRDRFKVKLYTIKS